MEQKLDSTDRSGTCKEYQVCGLAPVAMSVPWATDDQLAQEEVTHPFLSMYPSRFTNVPEGTWNTTSSRRCRQGFSTISSFWTYCTYDRYIGLLVGRGGGG